MDDLLATPADSGRYEHIIDCFLETLKKYKVEAIGFVNESWLYMNGKFDPIKVRILKQWPKVGMQLRNHNYYSYDYIDNTSLQEFKENVLKRELINRVQLVFHGYSVKEYLLFPGSLVNFGS